MVGHCLAQGSTADRGSLVLTVACAGPCKHTLSQKEDMRALHCQAACMQDNMASYSRSHSRWQAHLCHRRHLTLTSGLVICGCLLQQAGLARHTL